MMVVVVNGMVLGALQCLHEGHDDSTSVYVVLARNKPHGSYECLQK